MSAQSALACCAGADGSPGDRAVDVMPLVQCVAVQELTANMHGEARKLRGLADHLDAHGFISRDDHVHLQVLVTACAPGTRAFRKAPAPMPSHSLAGCHAIVLPPATCTAMPLAHVGARWHWRTFPMAQLSSSVLLRRFGATSALASDTLSVCDATPSPLVSHCRPSPTSCDRLPSWWQLTTPCPLQRRWQCWRACFWLQPQHYILGMGTRKPLRRSRGLWQGLTRCIRHSRSFVRAQHIFSHWPTHG
jgi:hypothetical protein